MVATEHSQVQENCALILRFGTQGFMPTIAGIMAGAIRFCGSALTEIMMLESTQADGDV